MNASDRLGEAAGLLEESAGHVAVCRDGASASYGDTPLDDVVVSFANLWGAGLLRIADVVAQLSAYTAEVERS